MVLDENAVCLTDAQLPIEMQEHRHFTYNRFTVNAHKCLPVCFTPLGLAAPPLPHVYIHVLLHRLGAHPVHHYQLPLKRHSQDHQNAHKHVWVKPMSIRDALLVIFLNGYVTEMKKMGSRASEKSSEIYRLAVNLVICVIFTANESSQLATF